MSESPLPVRIGLVELKQLLQAADSGALLVPPRILRRVIKLDRRLAGIGLQVPHRKCYVIDRDALLKLADKQELELEADRPLPRTVILIGRPDPERLAAQTRGEALIKYWRLLFHCRAHLELEKHELKQTDIHQRIQRIGQTEFDEIRCVLRQEDLILPPDNNRTQYVEFSALYWELHYFAPGLLPRYFPALDDRRDIEKILSEDINAAEVFAATRLFGAPEHPAPAGNHSAISTDKVAAEAAVIAQVPSEAAYHSLISRADAAAAKGNVVRAALLRDCASHVAGLQLAEQTHAAAIAELDKLAKRLQTALNLKDSEVAEWHTGLTAFLPRAASGIWPVEARLLYDLQKACIDQERAIYALDVVEWIVSLGKQPIKRLLPHHGDVLMAKHFHSATRRLTAVRLADPDHKRLSSLLHAAVETSERRLRERLRPRIDETLEQVGLQPSNFPENVARGKLVEELLDLIVERGYLTMGDLRDAISRNNLKLQDLKNPEEFLLGDRLIRTNRRLAIALDGVYRRGEIYLRWLQRGSSVAFGTNPGRMLTRFLVVPFGIAFVTIEGLLHLVNPVRKLFGHEEFELPRGDLALSVGLLGMFLFAVIHIGGFRKQVVNVLGFSFHLLRALFLDLPSAFLDLPLVRAVRSSRPYLLVRNFVFKPTVLTAVVSPILPLYGVPARPSLITCGILVVLASLLMNSRLGRTVEEAATDSLLRTWVRFRVDIFPALFAFTMALFKSMVEAVERLLYTVDEWLRFRTGDSQLSLVTKTVLGFFWFFVTYVVRIYVNLFIEPTVNPIKHFPVVTVSAKLILPFLGILEHTTAAYLTPLGPVMAHALASINVILLPGVFGFLVWEFKENWRLYAANRSKTLRPVMVGHHGETLSRLLKPGFHSGTVPKLYSRLRKAERRAHRPRASKSANKQREALHHVEARVRHFVEREFLALLNGSKCWKKGAVSSGKVLLTSNRIAFELILQRGCKSAVWIAFEERSGWLVACVANTGWLTELIDQERDVLQTALAGLYKLANVDLIREQIETCFASGSVSFDILYEGLVVWPNHGSEVQAIYQLRNGPLLQPEYQQEAGLSSLPAIAAERLRFGDRPIPWAYWVETWQADQAGKPPPDPFLSGVRLLPVL